MSNSNCTIDSVILFVISSQLFKSIEFGNGSRISDEKEVILEFRYLQKDTNKLRIKKSYMTY